VDVNPALMAKLPVEFKSLGMSVHHDMDDLAAAAEAGKTSQELLGSLGQTLSKCVACHASWQLQAAQ
jgi:cytochrome c556